MDESGGRHSQQTDTRTENEIPCILTHRRVMKNENTWTQSIVSKKNTAGGVLNTGVYWGEKGRASGRGRWGGIAWGEMPNVGEGEKGNKTHCHVCTYGTVLHVLHMYPKT